MWIDLRTIYTILWELNDTQTVLFISISLGLKHKAMLLK
jgi:hypothetical protein